MKHVQILPNTLVSGIITLPVDSFSSVHIEVRGIKSD